MAKVRYKVSDRDGDLLISSNVEISWSADETWILFTHREYLQVQL
jgi:hypothetical protein